MDADQIRKQLREIQVQLQRVEAERTALMSLATGYESWLRIYDPKQNGYQSAFPPADDKVKRPRPKGAAGKVTIRGAIRDVLMAARGTELHSTEIWRRVEAMGAKTDVLEPVDLVDLNLVSIRKRDPRFKKVGKRMFKFEEGGTVSPAKAAYVARMANSAVSPAR